MMIYKDPKKEKIANLLNGASKEILMTHSLFMSSVFKMITDAIALTAGLEIQEGKSPRYVAPEEIG